MPSRRTKPKLRVQRLPKGLFGYRRDDVMQAAERLDEEEQAAEEQFTARAADQEAEIARLRGRLGVLDDVLSRLRRDRAWLAHLVALARANASVLDEGSRREVDRLTVEQETEQSRLRSYMPRVEQEITDVEAEVRRLAQRLAQAVRDEGAVAPDAASNDFADVAAALFAKVPDHFPTRRLPRGRTLFELAPEGARLQLRGGAVVGKVIGVVVISAPPHRVLGFAVVEEDGRAGAVPAADVAALRQSTVLVRDGYRLVDEDEVPDEAARAIFPVARAVPAADGGQAADTVGAAQENVPRSFVTTMEADIVAAVEEAAAGQEVAGSREDEGGRPSTVAEDARPVPPVGAEAGADLASALQAGPSAVAQDPPPSAPHSGASPDGAADDAALGREATDALRAAPGADEVAPPDPPTATGRPERTATGEERSGLVQGVEVPRAQPVVAGGSPGQETDGAKLSAASERGPGAPAVPAAVGGNAARSETVVAAQGGGESETVAASAFSARAAEPAWPEDVPVPTWLLEAEGGPSTAPASAGDPAVKDAPQPPQLGHPRRPVEPAASAALTPGLNIIAFLEGKVVGRDIVASDGSVLAVRGTPITAQLVERVEAAGMLPEMIVYMTVVEGPE